MVARLDGLGEYDVRRPLVPSGTNLLGLVKHLAAIELGYLGDCVGRPSLVVLPGSRTARCGRAPRCGRRPTRSAADIVDLYRTAWRHSDESIATLPLDAPAEVPWWPDDRRATTFGSLLVRMVAETAQHAGHADILRETVDGANGAGVDPGAQAAFATRVQAAADTFGDGAEATRRRVSRVRPPPRPRRLARCPAPRRAPRAVFVRSRQPGRPPRPPPSTTRASAPRTGTRGPSGTASTCVRASSGRSRLINQRPPAGGGHGARARSAARARRGTQGPRRRPARSRRGGRLRRTRWRR